MASAKKVGRCNLFPAVWAAIYGCEGTGSFSHWEAPWTSGGRHRAMYGCAACRCGKALVASLPNHAYQEALSQVEALAGVENYRHERTTIVDGRPCLVGRELLTPFSERWTDLRPMTITGWVEYNFAGERRRAPILEATSNA